MIFYEGVRHRFKIVLNVYFIFMLLRTRIYFNKAFVIREQENK